ncbi:sugar phosphate isomerase/epimerase [Clostridium sp. chh4-2]|uniref:sugar phosphate isomerase/epimerase family protein n=1 Tax=Clostridium sp. chh4-2 TaxID=2067550 RepID=UPI000CCF2B8D|nr:sugar phosphate isomerase/epimerase family protein [Clostridium sp. chh4-2]PNV62661.1 sugar phosphate isomerase/epimerase [Clostridium sp. chh4-2]
MNYGMRCHDLCPKGDFDTVFDAVKAHGVDQIQLAFGKSIEGYDFNYGHYSPGFGRMISNKLKERQIHVAILGCYINPVNPDETKRMAEVHKFIEHLKYAKAIGADMVGTETGRYDVNFEVAPYTYTEGCYQLFLKSMREIVSAAEKLGMIVGVEAVHNHTLYCPEMMKRFLDDIDSPNVEAIFDPVNLISSENYEKQEEIVERALSFYGDRITMVHIKDFVLENGRPKFAHVGEGMFNYKPVLKYLKENKPYVTMLLENSNADRYHSDVEYLQKIYSEV